MTLLDVIKMLEAAAAAQPAVHTIVRQDARRLNDCPDAKYGVFSWVQGTHTRIVGEDEIHFVFNLFYIDRLTADRKNETEIQSVGIQVLDNILHIIDDNANVLGFLNEVQFTPFDYRFADECAGVYTTVRIVVSAETTCAEEYYINDKEIKII